MEKNWQNNELESRIGRYVIKIFLNIIKFKEGIQNIRENILGRYFTQSQTKIGRIKKKKCPWKERVKLPS